MTTELIAADGADTNRFELIRRDFEDLIRQFEGYQYPNAELEDDALTKYCLYPDLYPHWGKVAAYFGGRSGQSVMSVLRTRMHDAIINVLMSLARKHDLNPNPFYEGGLLCRKLIELRPETFGLAENGWPRAGVPLAFPECIVAQRDNLPGYERGILDRCGAEIRKLTLILRQTEVPAISASDDKEAGEVFTPDQIAILKELDGKALKVEELACLVAGGDSSRLYRMGLKTVLEEGGHIARRPNVGWYRPDSPPLHLLKPQTDIAFSAK